MANAGSKSLVISLTGSESESIFPAAVRPRRFFESSKRDSRISEIGRLASTARWPRTRCALRKFSKTPRSNILDAARIVATGHTRLVPYSIDVDEAIERQAARKWSAARKASPSPNWQKW